MLWIFFPSRDKKTTAGRNLNWCQTLPLTFSHPSPVASIPMYRILTMHFSCCKQDFTHFLFFFQIFSFSWFLLFQPSRSHALHISDVAATLTLSASHFQPHYMRTCMATINKTACDRRPSLCRWEHSGSSVRTAVFSPQAFLVRFRKDFHLVQTDCSGHKSALAWVFPLFFQWDVSPLSPL